MSVWDKLSAINVNDHTEKKGQFTYLAWTWAWAEVKAIYPEANYILLPDEVYADGTREVRCEVSIDGLTHPMWLPVTNHQNKAIPNPNAFDVNTARMRCLVKCLAMFGLGHYIYAGESFPQAPSYTEEQKAQLLDLMAKKDGIGIRIFYQSVGQEVMDALFNSAEQGKKTAFKQEIRDLYAKGNEQIKSTVGAIQAALSEQQADSVAEILAELTGDERRLVNAALSEVELHQINEIERAAA